MAAQAWPSGCSAWVSNNRGYAYCTGGTGYVRATVTCKVNVSGAGTYNHTGNWVRARGGLDAVALCYGGDSAVGASYQTTESL